jgi:hypothetical protein
MALGTDNFTQADLDVSIPEIYGQKINDYFRYSLDLATFFVDRSDELAEGGDTIYTPNLSALSVNTKTNQSQVTLSSPTYTRQTLVVSTWKEASFVIEDREMAQLKKSYYMQDQLAKGGAYEVAQDLDDAIAALFSGFSQSVGASSTNVADSNLLAAIATLETAGTPGIYSGDVAFILHPNTFYRQIGIIDKFTLWQNTNSEMPREKRPTTMLYGIPVIVTPAVPTESGANGRLNVLAHKDAIHWARLSMPAKASKGMVGSEGVRVQQSYVHEYLGDLVTIDLCYGVVENRDTAAVVIKSSATVV